MLRRTRSYSRGDKRSPPRISQRSLISALAGIALFSSGRNDPHVIALTFTTPTSPLCAPLRCDRPNVAKDLEHRLRCDRGRRQTPRHSPSVWNSGAPTSSGSMPRSARSLVVGVSAGSWGTSWPLTAAPRIAPRIRFEELANGAESDLAGIELGEGLLDRYSDPLLLDHGSDRHRQLPEVPDVHALDPDTLGYRFEVVLGQGALHERPRVLRVRANRQATAVS